MKNIFIAVKLEGALKEREGDSSRNLGGRRCNGHALISGQNSTHP